MQHVLYTSVYMITPLASYQSSTYTPLYQYMSTEGRYMHNYYCILEESESHRSRTYNKDIAIATDYETVQSCLG